jgi:hypothetical protein
VHKKCNSSRLIKWTINQNYYVIISLAIDDRIKGLKSTTKQLNKINTNTDWKVFGLTHPIKLRHVDNWGDILGTNI